ncbi:MAG TPA: hypothetical protein VEZ11_04050 [Thermoanaerobaculia bacterium]|nr:hypothetical protein [Thermoanaerobaculia bacterium]
MKRLAIALLILTLVPSLLAAGSKECTLCAGAVADRTIAPATPIPLLLRIQQDDLGAAAAYIDALTPQQRKKTSIVISYAIDTTKDPLIDVEAHTKAIIEWARARGPFDAVGIIVTNATAAQLGYAIKRLAVSAQGLEVAGRIVLSSNAEGLASIQETGALAYVDVVLTSEVDIARTAAWLTEKDPSKRIFATVGPQAPNAFFDAAHALSAGATLAFIAAPNAPDTFAAIASFDNALAGDFAFDAAARVQVLDAKGNLIDMPTLSFVRGEDLATVVVPRGDSAAATIVSLAGEDFAHPRRIDASGQREINDSARKNGRFLAGVQPSKGPFAITIEHAEKPKANVTKEAIEVATQRGITVEEIIRNHQAYRTFQESIQPRYIARNTTKLRFGIGEGGEAIEATLAGDYFAVPRGASDWVWQDFYVNGVKWKHGRIPELPLIQPEKVTQLPLDIHLTNEYRYQLVRETTVLGYRTYEVRFDPPPNAPQALPLYRGTVWIDARTWARIRISMVQLNLTGEVLSNEEQVEFTPCAADTHAALSSEEAARRDGRSILWLPQLVSAQQIVSAAGRANTVLRETTFTNFRLDPPEFDALHQQFAASDARMTRETDGGLRYLEKKGDTRVVKEGFDNARLFLVGGIHHDAGLQYPVVPLGGIDYFNFDVGHRGIQTNVFFAGVIVSANVTDPNVANTRTNLGATFSGIAIPFTNSMFRNGKQQKSEDVKALPVRLGLKAGHPIFGFGKIDFTFDVSRISYQHADDTASTFVIPPSTVLLDPGIQLQYARRGWTVSGYYDYLRRTTWRQWGDPAEYNPNQKSFTNFGASIGKSFYLPKFQRIGLELDYLDGQRLDRFSKYEFGFFGSQRIRGVESGSVRAEKATLGHLSYGLVFSDQFRLEAFYDQALIDDRTAGYHRTPFQGVGLGGQTIGPWGTILRFDLGKTVGQNSQSGFVANVLFLKLF